MLSAIGIIIAIIFMSWSIYKGLNPVIAAFLAGFFMMITGGVSVTETFDAAMQGVGSMLVVLVPLIVFGGIMGWMYAKSGASTSLGQIVLVPTRKIKSPKMKIIAALTLFLLLRALIGFSGMDASALIVPMASLCLTVCHELNIPNRYIPALTIIGATVGNIIPATPSTYNVMCETVIPGFTSGGAFVLRILMVILLIAGTVFMIYRAIQKDYANGLGFVQKKMGMLETREKGKNPHIILTLLPILAVWITYNFCGFAAWSSLAVGTVLSVVLFAPYIEADEGKTKWKTILETLDRGTFAIPLQVMTVIFASNVMTIVPGLQTITDGLLSTALPMHFVLLIVAMILMGFGGSAALVSVGALCTSTFIAGGISPLACGVITIWAATVFDTLPTNNAIYLTCTMVGEDMKTGYPMVFKTSVLLTFVLCVIITLVTMTGII